MFVLERRAVETPVVKLRTRARKIQQPRKLSSRIIHGRRDRKLNYILKGFSIGCFPLPSGGNNEPIGANNYLPFLDLCRIKIDDANKVIISINFDKFPPILRSIEENFSKNDISRLFRIIIRKV